MRTESENKKRKQKKTPRQNRNFTTAGVYSIAAVVTTFFRLRSLLPHLVTVLIVLRGGGVVLQHLGNRLLVEALERGLPVAQLQVTSTDQEQGNGLFNTLHPGQGK